MFKYNNDFETKIKNKNQRYNWTNHF